MDKQYLDLMEKAKQYSTHYINNIHNMSAFPDELSIQNLSIFDENLPNQSSNMQDVLKLLYENGATATSACIGGRYFGFVTGGLLPIAHASQWITDTWNQNNALYVMSPISSKLESICEKWIIELFKLNKNSAIGLVTGSSNAIICALATARNHIYKKQGYDFVQNGMRNAPKINVVISEQAHVSVKTALTLLGFGKNDIQIAPVDEFGAIIPDKLPEIDSNTLLILQAGNVNGGSFDPINTLCDIAKEKGAWVHIDGAFGLWARTSKKQKYLVEGMEKADSFSTDAHKTLNAGYDCGIVICSDKEALTDTLSSRGEYLQPSENRDGMNYVTEMSRKSRGIILWSILKQLGKQGIEDLIDKLCENTKYFAEKLEEIGYTIVTPPTFNQFIIKAQNPNKTENILNHIQKSKVCWCGNSIWNKEFVIRLSVCSHSTTKSDIDKSLEIFKEAFETYK